jgi:hypothetical protein
MEEPLGIFRRDGVIAALYIHMFNLSFVVCWIVPKWRAV